MGALSWILISAALAGTPVRCGTPFMWEELLSRRRPLPLPPGGSKVSDTYDLPNSLTSEHFVMHWGNDADFDSSDVLAVLETFETAWDVEVEAMEHPQPLGTDVTLFNVYAGDSGNGAPSDRDAAGYYNLDDEGQPMIVLSQETVAAGEGARTTTAHELYHAVQYATDNYDYSGDAAWYWEATAVWIEAEVWPEDDRYAVFLFGFALLPHYPVNHFDYPDTGSLEEYYQYGAFIFPRYLSEFVADWELIRDSWVNADGEEDPLEVLRLNLEAMGEDLELVFDDFSARNVTWDYADGAAYGEWVETFAPVYASQDYRVVAEMPSGGSDDWQEVPEDLLPQRYGSNVIEMERPDDGDLLVEFEGDPTGERGGAAQWGAVLVQDHGASVVYTIIDLEDGAGSLSLEDVGSEDAISLVVTARTEVLRAGETFSYAYRMALDPAPGGGSGDDDDDSTGADPELDDSKRACGCASVKHASPRGFVLTGLIFLWTCRRRFSWC